MNKLLIALSCLISLSMMPLALLSAPMTDSGPVLAIFPPWKDIDLALINAGATEVAPLRAPFAVLVDTPTETIQTALRAQGAWTLLDGTLIAAICGT